MLCPKCNTENQETSNFCEHCGAPLKKRVLIKVGKGKWIFALIGVVIFAAGLAYFFQDTLSPSNPIASLKKTQLNNQEGEDKPQTKKVPPSGSPVKENAEKPAAEKEISPEHMRTDELFQLHVGWVVIKNPWGREVSKILSAVVNGSLIALPTGACLGGDKWLFRFGEKDELTIERGIWREGDIVGLWTLGGEKTFQGPELFPWKENEPLEWLSLESADYSRPIEVSAVQKQGFFMRCSLPGSVNEPGIFIQNKRVVGWTFGSLLDGGFLWAGPEGKNLDYEISVEDFYNTTFADGREEQFSRALAMGKDISALDRLEAFVKGFRLDPKLGDQETPPHLRHDSILRHIRLLVVQLIEKGLSENVADILDHDVILEISDPYLLMDVIWATAQSYGFESALELAEDVGEYIKQELGREIPKLDRLHSQLFKSWIRELIKNRDLQNGLQTFERGSETFPDDPEIHLLGVELALAGEDWAESERLLYMRDYPKSLTDRVRILGTRISELKSRVGKIVIRFTPGSGKIPVRAVVNRTFQQSFLVDTGATMVTVPSSTIEALRIDIDSSTPRRKISTIGGIVVAPEVVLSSIEIDGWVTRDVKALVFDIPNQSGLGLLGLNYLHRFRMELNNEEGVLLLEPR